MLLDGLMNRNSGGANTLFILVRLGYFLTKEFEIRSLQMTEAMEFRAPRKKWHVIGSSYDEQSVGGRLSWFLGFRKCASKT